MSLIPIIPRHLRILGRLVEQRRIDQFGCIGWRGLLDDPETFTMDQLFKPLLERGLIEDLSQTPLGHGGTYFVRVTPLGQFCYGIGYMIKDARVTTELEIKKYISTPPTREEVQTQQELNVIRNAQLDIAEILILPPGVKREQEEHIEGTA